MPLIEAFIPESALSPLAEARLMKELTDILVSVEGIEPENERARARTVIFLLRPKIFVAGVPSASARYRFVPWLPEGKYDDEVRSLIVKAVTGAVARAEGKSFEDVSSRVWVSPSELPGAPSSQRTLGMGPILDALLDKE